jgi:TRAP-type mannitol/chloroaromatic compound transport system permease large subunit
LFYLRGVAPNSITTAMIYKGAIPFVGLQIFALVLLFMFPILVLWLPGLLFG